MSKEKLSAEMFLCDYLKSSREELQYTISKNPTKVILAMEKFAELQSNDFESVVRPVIKYLCENHHPNVTVIITPTNAELFEGQIATGHIMDYVVD
jgi:hypothetical protein